MRNKLASAFVGIIFIALGILFAGNVFEWWDFSIFFEGWWTLFIILPCIASMISNGVNVGNLIGLGIGGVLLLSARDIIDYGDAAKILVTGILILIGLSIIFRSFVPLKAPTHVKTADGKLENITAIFAGSQPNFSNMEFKGANCSAIMGGIDLNLKTAIINSDCEIACTAIMGGIDIILPPNVRVKLATTPILGGVDNKYPSSTYINAPTVYVNATCICGGLDIK